ncbi:hypothetical protein ACN47E_005988 [Coniothyrium glycines]
MPPAARSTASRGPGRPKRAAAPAPAPIPRAKRRRTAQAGDAGDADEKPAQKKRGRLANARPEASAPSAAPAPRRGRPPKSAPQEPKPEPEPESQPEPEVAPKKRRGRPAKQLAHIQEAPATSRRARSHLPPAASLPLHRVAATGSPRVAKRTSPRSKLRERLLPANKPIRHAPAPQPAPRGRPRRSQVLPPVIKPTKPKATTKPKARGAVIEPPRAAMRPRPVASRKPRGYTMLKIADRFAPQVQQYYDALCSGESSDLAPAEERDEVDAVGDEVEILMELAEPEASADSSQVDMTEATEIATVVEHDIDQDHDINDELSGGSAIAGVAEADLLTDSHILPEIAVDQLEALLAEGNAMLDEAREMGGATQGMGGDMHEMVGETQESADAPEEYDALEDSTEVRVEIDVQESVLVDQVGHDSVVQEHVDIELMLHGDGAEATQSLLAGDDSFMQEALRPSISTTFD